MKKFIIAFLMIALVLAGCGDQSTQPEDNGNMDDGMNGSMVFTEETLAEYNGENGQPAYIAVDGVVYDVTDVPAWNGGHQGQFFPGEDHSDNITKSPHGKGVLEDLTVVGTYEPSNMNDDMNDADDTSSASPDQMMFNKETLAMYNGKDGQPAYIAVDGVVYDVSDVAAWDGGHQGNMPGEDHSENITKSPHGKGVLEDLPIVGYYEADAMVDNTDDDMDDMDDDMDDMDDDMDDMDDMNDDMDDMDEVDDMDDDMVFTKETLAQYNGENGQPAYIAVDGVVYDVSGVSAWDGGHQGQFFPGEDHSGNITMSPHGKSVLSNLPVVGTYDDEM